MSECIWSISKIRKIGLFSMYVIDSFMETFSIKANGQTPITVNPEFVIVLGLLKKVIDSFLSGERNKKFYDDLLTHMTLNYDVNESRIKTWVEIPDIRYLEDKHDVMSWIFSVLVLGNENWCSK